MCLPCWPWTDIYLEKRVVNEEEAGVLAWDANARSMVRVTGVKAVKAVSIQRFFESSFPFFPWQRKHQQGHLTTAYPGFTFGVVAYMRYGFSYNANLLERNHPTDIYDYHYNRLAHHLGISEIHIRGILLVCIIKSAPI